MSLRHLTQVAFLVPLPLAGLPAAPQSPPVIIGLGRPGLSAVERGRVLLGELGCSNCHAATALLAKMDCKQAPRLQRVGERVQPSYLRRFLADPHGVKPGTTMPDQPGQRDAAGRVELAEQLTHFLVGLGSGRAGGHAVDPEAVGRGFGLFHRLGCVVCHAPRDEKAQELPGAVAVPLGRLAAKYWFEGLVEFLTAPHQVRPSGRMPDFKLSPREAHDLSQFLLQAEGADSPAPLRVDAGKAAQGRRLFAELDCVRCHAVKTLGVSTAAAPAVAELDFAAGCLSGRRGAWPYFALDPGQRRDLAAALTARDQVPSDASELRHTLASYNCVACHQRGKLGGISAAANEFFTSRDENLGEAGRLPPPLTGVGAKLQPTWLVESIAYGQSIRSYMHTRMPGFGRPVAEHLAGLFGKLDRLPPASIAELPKGRKKAEAVRRIGHQLVGSKGMNCIACHSFAGQRPEAMAAVDLVASTGQRLRREWFYHYMLDPLRFKADVLMPQFYPGGKSIRPDIAAGEVAVQLTGLWHYLAAGRNTRRPDGLLRPSMEIVVGEEAVMLRRKVQNTGKRGISVGYPGGVNLSFDAESLGLNQIWWGKFLDASGVWSGQGSGAARIMSGRRTELGKGPAFAELANGTAPWPVASRRELGQQFLGYDLDGKQRPTFRYRCHGVSIRDYCRELLTPRRPARLRRRLEFRSAEDRTIYFRVVRAARIEDLGEAGIRVGKHMVLHLPADSYRIRPAVRLQELLVEVAVVDGQAQLVIEYGFWEASK